MFDIIGDAIKKIRTFISKQTIEENNLEKKLTIQKVTSSILGYEVSRLLLFIIKLFIAIATSILFNIYLQKSLFIGFEINMREIDVRVFEFQQSIFSGFLILLIVFIFLWSLTGKFVLTTVFYSVAMSLLVFANNQKVELRQEPVFPEELQMIGQSQELLEMIDSKYIALGINILIMAVLSTIIYYFLVRKVILGKYTTKLGLRRIQIKHSIGTYIYLVGRFFAIVASGYILYFSYNFNDSPKVGELLKTDKSQLVGYNQLLNYRVNGFVTGFLYNMPVKPMAVIPEYSQEKMKEIEVKYLETASEINQTRVTNFSDTKLVYILSESLFNPSKVAMLEMDYSPLTEIDKVMQQSHSGKMLSTNLGGGTANTEYAALTGLSMANFQPQISSAYISFAHSQANDGTVVNFYKNGNQDKSQAVAIHPYSPRLYKRIDVFKNFGFDEFLYEGNLTYTDTHNGVNITDESAYLETLDELKKDQVGFIQLTTMQNHLPYGTEFIDRRTQEEPGLNLEDEDKVTFNNYLDRIKATDEATKNFLDQIELMDEDVTVLLYGDHIPGFMSKYADKMSDFEKFGTDFFIYSNHGRSQSVDFPIVSPIFFTNLVAQQNNAKISAYYAVLEELFKHIQAYSREVYYVDGQAKTYDELDDQTKEILEDYKLVQYDLTSGKEYLSDSFFKVTSK
ncbi:sulfatase-like hydrolase/transferase [Vagococcus sp. BWB3-3]|uniref:Sulfatase-like hydrolase/transferase n=1 Tax=Vagococcus allomyrinae TaxID=2794353 RepID=A0A940PF23_9ENTE|nr:alkaline phosphatase family protein [Vagococcus allomyrinae]MBP1043689.1 sulfatase-like hydrolase/transferase [Vagococcus allomyrinae]